MRPEKIGQQVQKAERKWKGEYYGEILASRKDRTASPGLKKR